MSISLVAQSSAFPSEDDPQRSFPQMWECTRCAHIRQWGIGPSPEPKERPYLKCACEAGNHIPHRFVGLRPVNILDFNLSERLPASPYDIEAVGKVFRKKAA